MGEIAGHVYRVQKCSLQVENWQVLQLALQNRIMIPTLYSLIIVYDYCRKLRIPNLDESNSKKHNKNKNILLN